MLIDIPPPPKIDVLNDVVSSPDFKEDSVREEIIVPILRSLGYSANEPNKIVRSKSLTHPFVYIGSIKRQISIIPDYLIYVDNKPAFVLDAKAPKENILEGKNPEQAYSYAIHRDIRCEKYVLCNGNLITIFSVSDYAPIYTFKVSEIEKDWEEIYKALSPLSLTKPHIFDFHLDLGMALKKSGFDIETIIHFTGFPVDHFARVNDDTFSTSKNTTIGDIEYISTYDFTWPTLHDLIQHLPLDIQREIIPPLTRQPYTSFFEDKMFFIDIEAVVGDSIETNDDESYVPFKAVKAKLSTDSTGFAARHPNGRSDPY